METLLLNKGPVEIISKPNNFIGEPPLIEPTLISEPSSQLDLPTLTDRFEQQIAVFGGENGTRVTIDQIAELLTTVAQIELCSYGRGIEASRFNLAPNDLVTFPENRTHAIHYFKIKIGQADKKLSGGAELYMDRFLAYQNDRSPNDLTVLPKISQALDELKRVKRAFETSVDLLGGIPNSGS